jgi:hypothetical protein
MGRQEFLICARAVSESRRHAGIQAEAFDLDSWYMVAAVHERIYEATSLLAREKKDMFVVHQRCLPLSLGHTDFFQSAKQAEKRRLD